MRHYDRTYDLDRIESVDFVVVPFAEFQAGAHTFLSFGFSDGEHLGVSVEVRRKKGEQYSALASLVKPYQLMYVVADERDLSGLRANHRLDDVYLYRTKARPEDARRLFVDHAAQRVTMMVRMEPGSSYPAHRHAQAEECFVLSGDLWTGSVRLLAGDYQRAEQGSRHPVQSTEGGCVLLLVSSLGDALE